MTMTRLFAWVLALFFLSGAAIAEPMYKADAAPKSLQQRLEDLKKPGLIFYVAKGPAGSCGEGCDTWIAAEGQFDREAPERLRRVLKRLGSRKLPIYFHSAGGQVPPSLELGHMLRKEKLTAGVGVTNVKACGADHLNEEACRKLKDTNAEVEANLNESSGLCASACVYTFIGASTRLVAQGAQLKVHSPLAVTKFSDGRVVLSSERAVRQSIADWRRYVTSMGIDGALMDVTTSVSFEQSRTLTRDEIARFKIDERQVSESAWKLSSQRGSRFVAYKELIQFEVGNAKYKERRFGIGCGPTAGHLALNYVLAMVMPDDKIDVRVEAGALSILLKTRKAVVIPGRDTRDGFIPLAAARMAASQGIVLSEQSSTETYQFKLSTVGLPDALDQVIKTCEGSPGVNLMPRIATPGPNVLPLPKINHLAPVVVPAPQIMPLAPPAFVPAATRLAPLRQ